MFIDSRRTTIDSELEGSKHSPNLVYSLAYYSFLRKENGITRSHNVSVCVRLCVCMSLFKHLNYLTNFYKLGMIVSKEIAEVRGPVRHFVTIHFFTVRRC
jgi:hypothetical protein